MERHHLLCVICVTVTIFVAVKYKVLYNALREQKDKSALIEQMHELAIIEQMEHNNKINQELMNNNTKLIKQNDSFKGALNKQNKLKRKKKGRKRGGG